MSDASRRSTGSTARVARALRVLASDLLYHSESHYPYRAFSAELPERSELTEETFRRVAGLGPYFELAWDSPDELFARYQDPEYLGTETARGYALLEKAMRALLSDLHLVYASNQSFHYGWRVRVYLFGRLEDGSLAGLSSVSVQT